MSWIETPENEIVGKFNLTELGVDEAYLNFSSIASSPLWLYMVSTNCFKCPYERVSEVLRIATGQDRIFKTNFPTKFRFRTSGTETYAPAENDKYAFCDLEHDFGEFGVYNWEASGSPQFPNCTFNVVADPVNIYLPLVLVVMFYAVFLSLCYFVGGAGYKRFSGSRSRSTGPQPSTSGNVNEGFRASPTKSERSSEERITAAPMACDDSNGLVQSPSRNQLISPPGSPAAAPPISSKQRQRLRSLDTFRGISIVVMIFVNDRGGDYFFFEHATWDGLYVADLVFPWFLWIMGVCIPIAIKSQLKKGTPRLKIFTAIVIRSVKLIGLGVILNSRWGVQFGEGANLRIPGILHRFGVCYLVCATLVLISMSVDIAKPEGNKIKAAIQDIGKLWVSWIIVLLILLAHCLLTFLLPIEENCPKGYLGPGGLHNNALVDKNCTGGAAGYLDREIFTSKHIYQSPTSRTVYNSEAYDPEGFLGTLTSIVQVWIGVQAGVTMMVYPRASSRLIRWGVWAVVTGGLGALLCGAKQNEGWIPVNKNLWSLSFVLVTTSFAFILLSVLYIVIDIKKWWSGSPLFEPGMNSIFLYLGHSIFYAALPWHWRIGRMATHFMNVTEALWGTSLWVLTAIWLHREKWYWSL